MSVDSDKLGTMVTEFTTLSENLSASLLKIDDKILDLTEQWKAIDYAQDQIEYWLGVYIEAYKADHFYTFGSFGVSGSGILWQWLGFDEESVSGLSYTNPHHVTCTGDQTSTFTAGLSALVTNGGTFSTSSTISGSYYDTVTHILFDDDIAAANVDGIYLASYAPWGALWDSDATVQSNMDNWVALDDFVTGSIGSTTGTYGIQERLANLYFAKSIVQIDKDKYDEMIPIMEPFAT